jgi:hypothetical protein
MSLFSAHNKNQNGFHVIVEVLPQSISLRFLAVEGRNYSELEKVELSHRITPENGLTQTELQKFESILSKGFGELGDKAKRKIGQNTKLKIKSSTAIIFYPWFVAEERDDIRIGKPGEMNTIREGAIEDALMNIKESDQDGKHLLSQYAYKKSVVETFVNSIKLNGYSVANPIGKKVRDVILSASYYITAGAVLDCLKKEILFHTGAVPRIVTFPHACALSAETAGSLFIYVDSTATTICSVTEKVPLIYASQMIPGGISQIIENVVKKSGTAKEVAQSYMRLALDGMLADDVSLIVKSARDEALASWKSKIDDALSHMNTQWMKKIILCRDQKLGDMFIKEMNSSKKEQRAFEINTNVEKVIFGLCILNV